MVSRTYINRVIDPNLQPVLPNNTEDQRQDRKENSVLNRTDCDFLLMLRPHHSYSLPTFKQK